ncbi:MAG: aminoacyl-tRNA hydrolase [Patescibacteria group bacterium]|nr:aminoacyl-tRNA hydrolase [Patescibacteria group bacterium]
MITIIGLGNPGKEYEGTRHNVGFFVVEKLRESLKLPEFNSEKKFKAEIAKGKNLILAKPQTFMNNSGEAVSLLYNFYKIDPPHLLVAQDDLDIPLGEYRIQQDKSSAGHKGVQSIIDALNTQNFNRLRIGIKTEMLEKIPAEDFVLQKFLPEEKEIILKTIKKALAEILPKLL